MGSSMSSTTQYCQTAKVIIFFDGSLREYEKPIRAGEILLQNPDHFLCDSDSLYVDRFMVAVNPEEELEFGGLYFLLPLRKLQYVLSVSDMASMLRKTNLAIRSTGYLFNWKSPQEKPDWAEESKPMESARKAFRLEPIQETLTCLS